MKNEIVKYISYAIEEYKKKHNLSGSEVSNYFKKYYIYDFIENNYDTLHISSSENLLLDIDEYVKTLKV